MASERDPQGETARESTEAARVNREAVRREREQMRARRERVRIEAERLRDASETARRSRDAAVRLTVEFYRAVAERVEILRVLRVTRQQAHRPTVSAGRGAEASPARDRVATVRVLPAGSSYQQLLDRIAAADSLDELELLRAAAHTYFATDARFATVDRMLEGKIKFVRARRALDREIWESSGEDIDEP
ncbi:MAG TPA: hypothetical protein VM076_21150 [Gemmatimonadaceae bacterium]|nr:hypothetical protein [Gemmatimonadaceae bacterium]